MAEFTEIRENAQAGGFQTVPYYLPDGLASILERKVDGTGLNCLEQIVDFVCMMLYDTYGKMSNLKAVLQRYEHDIDQTETIKIIRLLDGTLLYDLTPDGSVGVQGTDDHELYWLTLKTEEATRRVFFTQINEQLAVFGRLPHVQYLVIQKNAQGVFLLAEEAVQAIRTWTVDPICIETAMHADDEREDLHVAMPHNEAAKELDRLKTEAYYKCVLDELGFHGNEPKMTELRNQLRLYDGTAGHKVTLNAKGHIMIDGTHLFHDQQELPIYTGTKGGVVTVEDYTHEGRRGYLVKHSKGPPPIFFNARSHLD